MTTAIILAGLAGLSTIATIGGAVLLYRRPAPDDVHTGATETSPAIADLEESTRLLTAAEWADTLGGRHYADSVDPVDPRHLLPLDVDLDKRTPYTLLVDDRPVCAAGGEAA